MIVRVGVSGAAVGLASLPAFLMPACLSSSSATGTDASAGNSSSSSSGGSGSGSSSGGATDGGSGASCTLDDMSTSATTTGGYWFTYSDRTCPNSALLMPDAAGTLSPQEGYASNPAVDMTGAPLTAMIPALGMPVGYREFSGGGEKTWGAGFGFNLLNNGMDPFTGICAASTCTGIAPAVDAAVGFPNKYDASMHKGISFYAKSLMATATLPTKVRVQLSDKHTDPGSGMPDAALASGMCDQCDNTNGGPNRCTNDFYQSVNIGPTWAQYTVLFSQIATDTWTKTYAKGQFDSTTLYHVHWQLNAPTPMFDIQIACVSWIDM